jgi:hypothetical protein
MMNREEAFSLLVMLQDARRTMDIGEPLAFVRASVMGRRQQPFLYDVLAALEEAADNCDYNKFKGLLTTAISFINKALNGSGDK